MSKNILFLVEGEKTEKQLIEKMLQCYPEINVSKNNVIYFKTNIYKLYQRMTNFFGDDWYEQEDLNFIEFLQSLDSDLKGKKVTDIYLVFDYERQDEGFTEERINQLLHFFNNSTENGKLYINYPMIESYRHFNKKILPDDEFKERKCYCQEIKGYKEIVSNESKFKDIKKFDRNILNSIVKHNIKKTNYILNNKYELLDEELIPKYLTFDFERVLEIQNDSCRNFEEGYIYVLCTFIFFIIDYDTKLIF